MPINHRIVLDNRPQGEASAQNFKMVELPLPDLKDGEVLVCHHYLSLDPYMRGRMNESKSYAVPQPLGEVMIGGTVGEVVDSRHPKFKAGDAVVGMGGWQEYSAVDANVPGALRKVDTTPCALVALLGCRGHARRDGLVWFGQNHRAQSRRDRDRERRQWCRWQCLWRTGQSPWLPRGGHCRRQRQNATMWSTNWALTPASTTKRTKII